MIVRRLLAASRARADICETKWSGGECTLDSLVRAVTDLLVRVRNPVTIELVCHPARIDDRLRVRSGNSQVESRFRELEVLCDPDLGRRLREVNVRIAMACDLTAMRTSGLAKLDPTGRYS